MYLIVLLLISTAFGRPNSAQLDVGVDIVNQLDSIVLFINEMGSLLGNSELIRPVSEGLQAAELNLLEIETGLNTLQEQVPGLRSRSGSYVASFNETESFLNQTKQELRDLAETTVAEVRDVTVLLEDLDTNNDTDLLKLAMIIIKDLMIETKERLEGAREKYQSAIQAFHNIISSVESRLNVTVEQGVVRLDCQTAAWKTLGICASVHRYDNEVSLENSRVQLGDLKSKSDRFLDITRFLKYDINVAINLINAKIWQINTWAESTDDVDENIEEYPAEYLEKYKTLKTVFRNGLYELKNVAEQFLVDRITTSSRFADLPLVSRITTRSRLFGRNDEHLRDAEQNILEMEAELKSLQPEVEQLQNEARYFAEFNNAKSYLTRTRQELRELAHRTVTEERNLVLLLDSLYKSNSTQVILLKIAIANMKDQMIETKERLEEALAKYNEAQEAFLNLIFSLKRQNKIVDDSMIAMNAKYLKDKAYTEQVRYNCMLAAVFTLGLCSLIHHFENEVPLSARNSDRLLGRTRILNRDIDDAIVVINEEVELIFKWVHTTMEVSNYIELYPVEYLVKYLTIRRVFKSELVDLKDVAKNYLDLTQ